MSKSAEPSLSVPNAWSQAMMKPPSFSPAIFGKALDHTGGTARPADGCRLRGCQGNREFISEALERNAGVVLPDDYDRSVISDIRRATISDDHIGEAGVATEAADMDLVVIRAAVAVTVCYVLPERRVDMQTDVPFEVRES